MQEADSCRKRELGRVGRGGLEWGEVKASRSVEGTYGVGRVATKSEGGGPLTVKK